jgi:hypothetical protein
MVTSKPKRISEYSGLVHMIILSYIYENAITEKFLTANTILHRHKPSYVRNTRERPQDYPYLLSLKFEVKKTPISFDIRAFYCSYLN